YVAQAAQPANSTQISSNRGNSNFDIRNRVTWSVIYELPRFGGSWQKLKNGWGVNGVLTVQSGQPFHLIYSEDDYDGSGTFFPRADVVAPVQYNYSDPTQFLALSSFAVPCTLDGAGNSAQNCLNGSMHFGNEGRNSLLGPNFRQFDFSIFKNTS